MCIVYYCTLLIRAYVYEIMYGWVESCVTMFGRQIPVGITLL